MKKTWWKESIVYQIYPRSFNDSNNDGIGDIRGVIQKLDYVQSLGVDVIWLCPVYDSPNDDNGYDIRDYYAIMEEFGTMADFDELLAGIHNRGMKLIMDLVVNHTSDEHAWFAKSKSSLDNDKRDFYVWKDGEEGNPPNNWGSFFSGSAWEKAGETDQYYLHLFTKKQPDLNWENEEVRHEIYRMMNWWMEKGVDGFRMDVISLISKRDFEDSPYPTLNETIDQKYANGPKLVEYLEEMVNQTTSKRDVMTVGEGPGISFDKALGYVDESKPRLDMIFHFGHMFMDHGPGGRFDPTSFSFQDFKQVFIEWDKLVDQGGWPAIFLGNHDFPRIVSRFGSDTQEFRVRSAKALSLMLLTLRGTTYIYQGDEIGMTNLPYYATIDAFRDVETINAYVVWKKHGKDDEAFFQAVQVNGRDNARTPIQWDKTTNGGFSQAEPWIDSNPNFDQINVADQESDSDSILNFYRKAIHARKENSTLVYGDFEVMEADHPSLFAYKRTDENGAFLVMINCSEKEVDFAVDIDSNDRIVLSNYPDATVEIGGSQKLRAWEAVLVDMG